MNELSLFSGAGGGLLGTKLLGWKNIGYVEFNNYCQQVLAQRISDGYLDEAPIFTDVREFLLSGAADQYCGFADVVTAGFPCQPFSIAGRQQEARDDRNMWKPTLGIICAVKPRYALLENVTGLLSLDYIRIIFRDLAEAGYNARWCVLGADDCGALHRRKRIWILADAIAGSDMSFTRAQRKTPKNESEDWQTRCAGVFDGTSDDTEILANIHSEPIQRLRNADWKIEPKLDRVVDGMANRVDRIKALGNGQVPIVAATAWKLLSEYTCTMNTD